MPHLRPPTKKTLADRGKAAGRLYRRVRGGRWQPPPHARTAPARRLPPIVAADTGPKVSIRRRRLVGGGGPPPLPPTIDPATPARATASFPITDQSPIGSSNHRAPIAEPANGRPPIKMQSNRAGNAWVAAPPAPAACHATAAQRDFVYCKLERRPINSRCGGGTHDGGGAAPPGRPDVDGAAVTVPQYDIPPAPVRSTTSHIRRPATARPATAASLQFYFMISIYSGSTPARRTFHFTRFHR